MKDMPSEWMADKEVSTGQCYPPETLKRIMEFCGRTKIHLISDEVYAMSVFGPGYLEAVPFTSVLSIDPTGLMDPEYVQVMYGMSKVNLSDHRLEKKKC